MPDREVVNKLPKVVLKHKAERFDSLHRRFKRAVEKADTLQDLRKHEYFEKSSERKKRERAAARKREQRRIIEESMNRQSV